MRIECSITLDDAPRICRDSRRVVAFIERLIRADARLRFELMPAVRMTPVIVDCDSVHPCFVLRQGSVTCE